MNAREYCARRGLSIYALHRLSGVSYSWLHAHIKHGRSVGLAFARKLEKATRGDITAAEVLGLVKPLRRAVLARRLRRPARRGVPS